MTFAVVRRDGMRHAESKERDDLLTREKPWYLLRFKPGIPPDRFFSVKLAWPAYAWRVIAPVPQDKEMDALERAIIRLVAAGKTNPYELGVLLGIDQALAKHVLEGNRSKGILDERFNLTRYGQEKLESLRGMDETFPPGGSLRHGWIFRDAISGDVIPVFLEGGDLPPAPSVAVEEATPLPYDGNTRGKPSPPNITYALQFYGKIVSRSSHADMDQWGLLTDESDPGDFRVAAWQDVDDTERKPAADAKAPEPPRLVSIVSSEPEPIDIETYLYVTPDDPSTWRIRSPWRPFPGGWLRQRLEWAIGHSKDLETRINQWLGEAQKRFPTSGRHLDECEIRVAEDFPILKSRLELKEVYKNLILAYNADTLFEENPANLDMVLVRYYKALELLLRACISGIQDKEEVVQKLGKHDVKYKLQNIIEYFSVKLPKFMINDAVGKRIRDVAHYGGNSLRDRALYLLVHAYYTEDSPFRSVLRDRPDIFDLIELVSQLRNMRGGHHDPDVNITNESEQAERVRNAAKTVIEVVASHYFGR